MTEDADPRIAAARPLGLDIAHADLAGVADNLDRLFMQAALVLAFDLSPAPPAGPFEP